MKTDAELLLELENNLKPYPNLSSLVLRELKKRAARPGWVGNNRIAQLILLGRRDRLEQAEKELSNVKATHKESLDRLRAKLNGNALDFDEQVHDVWAEIVAFNSLLNDEFTNLEVIPRSGSRKKADLKGAKDGKSYLVEVANIREPLEISGFMFDQLHGLYIRYPKKMMKTFHFEASNFSERFEKKDEQEVANLLREIADSSSDSQPSFYRTWDVEGIQRGLEVKIVAQGSFAVIGSARGYWVKDGVLIESNVTPWALKLLTVIGDKFTQLCEADPERKSTYLIVLRWNQSPLARVALTEEVSMLKETIENYYPKIFVEYDLEVKII